MCRVLRIAAALAVSLNAACSSSGRDRADVVIANATVVTMDPANRILAPASVVVRAGRIAAVDTDAAVAARWQSSRRIDARGAVLLPGLINTHTHAPMVLYRGLADDLPLMEWLQNYIFPAEAATVTPEFVRVGTRLAALEMIRSGTTTYADMYYFEEEIARATRDAGLRAVLGQTVIEFPVPDAPTVEEGLKRAESFLETFADDSLITPAVAPHSTYTLDAAALTRARDLAVAHDAPLLVHLAETDQEEPVTLERFGRRPVGVLALLDLWAPRVIAAHGVWVNDEEIALLAQHRVGVSHNPESNMKLASGTAPVPAYLRAGVAVGLGTDGAASNNDLDMFEAMRQAALLHKLTSRDPSVVSAQVALQMATRQGAAVLGLEDEIGSLEVGKRADLILVGLDKARHTPLYDVVSHLVYVARGDDVKLTMVEGRILMQDDRVLSLPEREVLADASRAAATVSAAVSRREPGRPTPEPPR